MCGVKDPAAAVLAAFVGFGHRPNSRRPPPTGWRSPARCRHTSLPFRLRYAGAQPCYGARLTGVFMGDRIFARPAEDRARLVPEPRGLMLFLMLTWPAAGVMFAILKTSRSARAFALAVASPPPLPGTAVFLSADAAPFRARSANLYTTIPARARRILTVVF